MASGASVLGIRYDSGVLLASDTLLSYGSMAYWPNIPRIRLIGKRVAVCATGDFADFQDVCKSLDELVAGDIIVGDGHEKTPGELFCYLHRMMYSKRCDFEPALCQFVMIGSVEQETDEGDSDGKKARDLENSCFVGAVDDIGTKWSADCVATGYGAHIAIPLMRKAIDEKQPKNSNDNNGFDGKKVMLTRSEAINVLTECLRVLFYRECKTINKFQIADASGGKVVISEPFSVDTNWDYVGFSFEKTAVIR